MCFLFVYFQSLVLRVCHRKRIINRRIISFKHVGPYTLLCFLTVVNFELSGRKWLACLARDWFTWGNHRYSAFLDIEA